MRSKNLLEGAALSLALVGLTGTAGAAEILVNADITTSTTWTANNTYNLQKQIYVRPGATLTIQAGTVLASTKNIGGSLAVCNGAQIHVLGTRNAPVIMTSTADVATWLNGDPKTGTWRTGPAGTGANEWGNLTLMGDAYISEDATPGNVATFDADNTAVMEGLTSGTSLDFYGGGDDDYDAGTVRYLSLRYGGKVVASSVELNGLSVGGIGRDTDIHHVDIMNNVDDGIEVWGGTVNFKYFSIWNVGDDSFDVDQGWRGKAQFGLIVQGYSTNQGQGSGVGDNAFEIDGAENSDWQPVTTTTLYNMTVVGQPISGDHGTAWRDNARVQYRNCLFLDLGERLVAFDNVDGDGAQGYGHNGTLSWPNTWTTNWNAAPAHANDPPNKSLFYTVQTNGKLAEIKDSVFFRNLNAAAYTEATARGVFDAANNNVLVAGDNDLDLPVRSLVRGPTVVPSGTLQMRPVIHLDPRSVGAAATSVAAAPNDGFFTPASFRGAFGDRNWLCEWTAAYAFGFTFCDDATAERSTPRDLPTGSPSAPPPGQGAAGTPPGPGNQDVL